LSHLPVSTVAIPAHHSETPLNPAPLLRGGGWGLWLQWRYLTLTTAISTSSVSSAQG